MHTGLVCQSPPLLDSFMTLALSFDPTTRVTSGFLGFQMKATRATPGYHLLEKIRDAASQIQNPTLIPTLMFDTWVNVLQREHKSVSARLRLVQEKTGLMS